MLRLLEGLDETLLFLAPFLVYGVFHLVFIRRYRPSWRVVVLLVAGLALCGTWLVWTGTTQGLRRGERYVPAMEGPGGEVVQGHGG